MAIRFHLVGAAFFLSMSFGSAIAQNTERFSEKTIQQLQAIQELRQHQSPIENKLSSQLLGAVKAIEGTPRVEQAPHLGSHAEISNEGLVRITINGQITQELESLVAKQGGRDIVTPPERSMMSTLFPLAKVRELAARPEVHAIELSAKPQRNTMPPSTEDDEGEIAHDAAAAREKYKATGSGVRVCVLSDSTTSVDPSSGQRIDNLANAKQNGSLPDVKIIRDYMGTDGNGEGVAMLEIVHRIAPDAELVFTTAEQSSLEMARNLGELTDPANGVKCDIIVDDYSYPDESPFGNGNISSEVAKASKAGILYFSSAANNNNFLKDKKNSGTWEGDFKASATHKPIQIHGKQYSVHEFSPGKTSAMISSSNTNGGLQHCSCISINLWWTDPPNNTSSDYIIAVLDQGGNVTDYSSGSHRRPRASVRANTNSRLVILKEASAPIRFLHLGAYRAYLDVGTPGAVSGHNAAGAANAFSVAEIDASGSKAPYLGGQQVHVIPESSDGPRRIFFDEQGNDTNGNPITSTTNLTSKGGKALKKPDITAASCVTTDVPMSPQSKNPYIFCGTSAAAPHAAAIAALIKSAHSDWTPDQIRKALTTTALDIETPGWDALSGYGVVMPGPALAAHP